MSDKIERTLLSLTGWCGDIQVKQPETLIGRNDKCDARIALSHISGMHCKVVLQPDGMLMVKDLSRNGAYVNGTRIGRERYTALSNGDKLSLTPPGEQSVESVAFVYHDSQTSSGRASVFANGVKGFNVTLVKQLGKGAFGEVFLGVSGNSLRAVKVVKKSQSNSRLYDEVRVMDKLRHPHIVGIYEVWDSKNHLAMTLDLASGGDLEQLLKITGKLSETDSKSLLVQVLNALAYLHGERVIHRDLKPENILLKMPLASKAVPHLLLTDFGLSKLVDAQLSPAQTICGTPFYIAPEIVHADLARDNRVYDERVDLWSAGILLFRFLNGTVPWVSGSRLADQILAASQHNPSLALSSSLAISQQCRQFLDKLVVEKSKRLFAREALKDEWFEEARQKVANCILWDNSQTQGLQAFEDTIPDRFVFPSASTPVSQGAETPVQGRKSSPSKRTFQETTDSGEKRLRSSASTDTG